MIRPSSCRSIGCDEPRLSVHGGVMGYCDQHRRGPIKVLVTDVDPDKQAQAWAGQVRFDTAIVELCDNPVHVR